MADISRITLPNGNTYDIKDSTARASIEAMLGGDAITFGGVTSTALTDAGTEKPTVDGSPVDPTKGQLYFYGTKEYLWDGAKWIELGVVDALGNLAYKDTVTVSAKYDKATSASYTNTNSTKSLTLSGTSANVTITAADNASGNYQPKGTVSQPTFSNGSITGSSTYTPAGSVSKPSWTGTKATGLTVSPASSGTATYTPEGSISAPAVTVDSNMATTIKNPTAVSVVNGLSTAAPGATAPANAVTYYSVSEETLSLYQLGATKTNSITTSDVSVMKGAATFTATAPTFTGTGKRLVLQDYTPAGSVGQPTFTGTEATLNVTGTATGTVSQPTFTGTKAQLSGTTTATGTVTLPTISLGHTSTNVSDVTVGYTP